VEKNIFSHAKETLDCEESKIIIKKAEDAMENFGKY
jgi:hypothetical protein